MGWEKIKTLGETTLLLLGWKQYFQSYQIFGTCFRKLVQAHTGAHNMTSRFQAHDFQI